MMPGSASFDPPPVPVDGAAVSLAVALFDRSKSPGERYTLLPNVRCERVAYRLGAAPPTAQFSYELDTSGPSSPFPSQAEQLWPLDAGGDGVVAAGSEVVVLAFDEGGDVALVFDGFADAPQMDITGRGQAVTFTASGVAVRCWDAPVLGSTYRDASDPEAGPVVPTGLPARFNPDGQPNCTPDGHDVHEGDDGAYPVFLDWRIRRTPDPRNYWNLGKLTRYLLLTRPPAPGGDLAYVKNPEYLAAIDDDLRALTPSGGDTSVIDVNDPSTYTPEDIIVDDVIATGKPWPEVLARVLERYGFAFEFVLGQDETSPVPEPTNTIEIYRKDGLNGAAPKDLYLQDGGVLDPGRSNAAEIHLVRDARAVANQFRVISRPVRYEAGVVLAAGFTIAAGDASDPSQFRTPNLAKAAGDKRRKYRVYVADEAGDGHWDLTATPPAWAAGDATDLSAVFGRPEKDDDPLTYVVRLRPGVDELFCLDDEGKPFHAELAISTDYAGDSPAVWDGFSGTWQSMGEVGWRLLRDRLGIEITTDNPNAWKIPDPPNSATPVVPGGVVKGVEAQAAPDAVNKRFFLKLTCVIEGDSGVKALAEKRVASPGEFVVERQVDATDVFRHDAVDESSLHFAGPPPTTWDHDDTDDALSRAQAYRSTYEFAPVAGRVLIPWFSLAYGVGDRIRSVSGRGIDFSTNGAAEAGESAYLPMVVAVTHDFGGGRQATTLELADHRSPPPPPTVRSPFGHRKGGAS